MLNHPLIALQHNQGLQIYSEEGILLQEYLGYHGQETHHIPARFFFDNKNIPAFLVMTLLAEDKRFFQHHGMDPLAVARAIQLNINQFEIVSGASTITQQLIRIVYPNLYQKKNFFFKSLEMVHAMVLDFTFSKRKILEMYLNYLPMPYNQKGIFAAAKNYYGRSIDLLNHQELALLVYSIRHPKHKKSITLQQANRLLKKFYHWRKKNISAKNKSKSENMIFQDKQLVYNDLLAAWHSFSQNSKSNKQKNRFEMDENLHFTAWLKQEYPHLSGKIESSIHADLNEYIQKIVQSELVPLRPQNTFNAAIVVLEIVDPQKPFVLRSLIGSENFLDQKWGQVNGVFAIRNAGSTLKPFVYGLAFEKHKIKPYDTIWDEPIFVPLAQGAVYKPENFDLTYWGAMSYHAALANSRNIPAVWTLQKIGIPEFYSFLKKNGFDHLTEQPSFYGPAMALGVGGTNLMLLTQMYAGLANLGQTQKVFLGNHYNSDSDQWDSILWGNQTRMFGSETSYRLIYILSNTETRRSSFGQRNFLDFPFEVAAKTGTSKDFRDSWTIGFTQRFVVGVWVGNFSGKSMHQISGINGAGRIFHQVMRHLTPNRHTFSYPRHWQKMKLCTAQDKQKKCVSYTELVKDTDIPDIMRSKDQKYRPRVSPVQIVSPNMGQTYILKPQENDQSSSIVFKIRIDSAAFEKNKYFFQINQKSRQPISDSFYETNLRLSSKSFPQRHVLTIYENFQIAEKLIFFVQYD